MQTFQLQYVSIRNLGAIESEPLEVVQVLTGLHRPGDTGQR